MAKYRLLTKHYMYDQLLEEGTIVGDETSFKITEEMVSPDMEGLDDEAKQLVQKAKDNLTKPMMNAPQSGMLYLEPDVRDAILDAAKKQSGTTERPHSPPQRSAGQPEPKEGQTTQLPNPPPVPVTTKK